MLRTCWEPVGEMTHMLPRSKRENILIEFKHSFHSIQIILSKSTKLLIWNCSTISMRQFSWQNANLKPRVSLWAMVKCAYSDVKTTCVQDRGTLQINEWFEELDWTYGLLSVPGSFWHLLVVFKNRWSKAQAYSLEQVEIKSRYTILAASSIWCLLDDTKRQNKTSTNNKSKNARI